jgi:hypothetical protein
MRIAVLGATVVAGLVIAALGSLALPSMGFAQRPIVPGGSVSSGLIAIAATAGDNKRQQLTVIDPDLRVMSVYHVDLSSGEIVLKSVRNIHWDLQMVEFNGTSPLPREIRSLLEQK